MRRFIYPIFFGLSVFATNLSAMEKAPVVALSFSDDRKSVTELKAVNDILRTVGVHVGQVDLPPQALPILKSSRTSKLDERQTSALLKMFSLTPDELLNQVSIAGRTPVIAGLGSLSTSEVGVAPYPKIYDMKAMSPKDKAFVQNKFGKLHVNSADSGEGVDEVMTLASGGPWTWYFSLKDNVVAKLSLSRVPSNGPGWRLSYPGLTPHGAFLDAEDGIVVAHITGPKIWVMRYDAPNTEGAKVLGKNPWINFSTNTAR